jgi:hypothetical protein
MAKCECGECGEDVAAQGQFLPGHDQKLRISLEPKAGGLLSLRELVTCAHGYFEGTLTEEEFTQRVRSTFARKLNP